MGVDSGIISYPRIIRKGKRDKEKKIQKEKIQREEIEKKWDRKSIKWTRHTTKSRFVRYS